MRLHKLCKSPDLPQPDFGKFERRVQPPLDRSKLALERRLVSEGGIKVPTDDEVVAVLQLTYKGKAGGTLGIAEDDTGELWNIPQVQGARTRKSYRLATGLQWERLLASDVRTCAAHDGAMVRRITMPPLYNVTNIAHAAARNIDNRYAIVKNTLEMRWSDELKCYVVDIPR